MELYYYKKQKIFPILSSFLCIKEVPHPLILDHSEKNSEQNIMDESLMVHQKEYYGWVPHGAPERTL